VAIGANMITVTASAAIATAVSYLASMKG